MTKSAKQILWGGLFFLLVILFALGWWRLHRPGPAQVSVAAYMPDEISVVVNIRDIENAWQRHWLHRQGPSPDEAFKEMLVALGEWEDWVERYGETGARLRMGAIQKAFFHVLGEEAWLIFGSWGGDGVPGEGEVGLVALIRSDTPVKARIGPFADLIFENYQIDSGHLDGEKIYAYRDEKLSRTLTFCQLGGWICVSMRQPGAGPLRQIIGNVQAASKAEHTVAMPPILESAWGAYDPDKSICALMQPQVFWAHFRRFNDQRGRPNSSKSQRQLDFWQQRLDGVKMITVQQTGSSLVNMDLRVNGPRPRLLAQPFARDEADPAARKATDDSAAWERPTDLSQMARVDMDLSFARLLLPLGGHDWDTLLADLDGLDLWVPGLRPLLQEELASDDEVPLPVRMGLIGYSSVNPMFPALRFWLDHEPCLPPGQWPASAGVGAGLAHGSDEDLSVWIQPFGNTPTTSTESLRENQWLIFEEETRRGGSGAALAFVSLNFETITNNFDRLPYRILGKKVRREVGQWHAITCGLSLAFGGAVLSMGTQPDGWRLSLRTP